MLQLMLSDDVHPCDHHAMFVFVAVCKVPDPLSYFLTRISVLHVEIVMSSSPIKLPIIVECHIHAVLREYTYTLKLS